MPVRSILALILFAVVPSGALALDEPTPALRERIARLALKQWEFGAVSLLPVTFTGSGLAGPFEEDGRTYFCVATRMKGRTFGRAEHVRIALRYAGDRLTKVPDDDVCAYHRLRPFPELTAIGNAR